MYSYIYLSFIFIYLAYVFVLLRGPRLAAQAAVEGGAVDAAEARPMN